VTDKGSRIDDVFRRLILPGHKDTLLLQWLLSDDPRPAFEEWLGRVGDPSAELQSWPPGRRGLLSHLGYVVRQFDLPAPDSLTSYLRAAQIHESFRAETYRSVIDEIMRVVSKADAPALYLLGVPMDELYPRGGVRHHGICALALPSNDAAVGVARALRSAGCELQTGPTFGCHALLRHRSELLIKVQAGFPLPALSNQFDEIYADAQPWAEPHVRIPSVSDALLEILAAFACDATRRQLDWLIDTHFCYRRMSPSQRTIFRRSAEQMGLERLTDIVIGFLEAKIIQAGSNCEGTASKSTSLSFAERVFLVSVLRARRLHLPLRLMTYAAAPPLLRHAIWPGRDVAAWFSEQRRLRFLSC
jgi:hypothetical protein